MWVEKTDLKYLLAYTSVKKSSEDDLYFDSGCSRHMTSNKSFLMNYKRCLVGYVTFGDGQRSQVIGRGTLMMLGLPRLENVLHVDCLKANLVSIS